VPKKAEPTGFAGRLKALREAAGLTQKELADRAGFHHFSVAKLEQGVQEPTWPTVLALARALGVNCLAFTVEDGGAEPVPQKRGPGRPRKQPQAETQAAGKAPTRNRGKGRAKK
jgi:putative transcriptional regulator